LTIKRGGRPSFRGPRLCIPGKRVKKASYPPRWTGKPLSRKGDYCTDWGNPHLAVRFNDSKGGVGKRSRRLREAMDYIRRSQPRPGKAVFKRTREKKRLWGGEKPPDKRKTQERLATKKGRRLPSSIRGEREPETKRGRRRETTFPTWRRKGKEKITGNL